jgi:hypothetical protein
MIEHDDCLRLLASDEIGRLAVVAGNTAIVVPVNYPLYGHVGAFPTDEHSMQDEYLASPTGAPTSSDSAHGHLATQRAGSWHPHPRPEPSSTGTSAILRATSHWAS